MGKLRAVNAPDKSREALATAIATRNEMRERSLDAHAAQRRAQEALDGARQRADAAGEAVEQARQDHALAHTTAVSSGRPAPTDKTLRAARSELEVAADDAEAAEHALRTLTEACTEPDAELEKAERRVDDAAHAVMAERAPDTLREAEALALALSHRLLELRFLHDVLDRCREARRRKIVSEHDTGEAIALLSAEPDDAVGKQIDRLLAQPLAADASSDWRNHPHLESWRNALASMQKDADAAAP
jgi:hypothetical protein